jgi:sRNA-binding protein
VHGINIIQEKHVAKPNYQYEKRQRELEKKKKKEEKAQRKAATHGTPSTDTLDSETPAGDAPDANPGAPQTP